MNDRQCSIDDVRDALGYISPETRDTWIMVLHAVKEEFGEDGRDLCDSWSQDGSSYKEKDFRTVWKGIKPTRGIGIGPVFKAAIDAGFKFAARSEEDRQRLEREAVARRQVREAEWAREAARVARCRDSIMDLCQELVRAHMKTIGRSPYLGEKRVRAFGIHFMAHSVVARIWPANGRWELMSDGEEIKAFFADHKQYGEDEAPYSFRYLKPGTIGVPLVDEFGALRNLQFIFATGAKSFFSDSPTQGLFHLIGPPPAPSPDGATSRIWIAEGYATAASVHMAIDEPVVMALYADNLLPVARKLREKFPFCELVFAADNDAVKKDDPPAPRQPVAIEAELPHNSGVKKAREAAAEVGGRVVVPDFFQVQEVA